MLRWLKSLFFAPWEVRPCGCKWRQGSYTPLEWEPCPPCDEAFKERMRYYYESTKDDPCERCGEKREDRYHRKCKKCRDYDHYDSCMTA